jgi:hypothetical protein
MYRSILAIAACTALIISGPAYAQHGNGGGKPTTSPSSTHVKSSPTKSTSSGATTHGKSSATTQTTHGNSASHGPATKPTSSGTVTHGKSGETHGGGSTKHADTSSTSTKKSSTSTSSTSTTSKTGTGSTTTLTPVQQKLVKNTNLADKLRTRLPGVDLLTAAEGFKNLGQFVAAVNVSANHPGVEFMDLKTRMVDQGMSLGQALQDVKKTANVSAEVKKAEVEADAMIKSSTTSTTTSTTTPTTSTKKTKTKSTGDR